MKITKVESYKTEIQRHELVKILQEAGWDIPDNANFNMIQTLGYPTPPPTPLVITWMVESDQEQSL